MLKIHSDTAEAPSWNCLKGFDPVRLSDSVALKLEYQVGAGHKVQLNLHARFNDVEKEYLHETIRRLSSVYFAEILDFCVPSNVIPRCKLVEAISRMP